MGIGGILAAAALVGGTGLFIGIFLGIFSEKFKVETDEREIRIREVLPGNNCGGCGYAGCDGLAAAIAGGKAPVDACPVGGSTAGSAIGKIMGVEAQAAQRKTAFVKCAGDCEKAKELYEYYGVEDCQAMTYMPNHGPKKCQYGCTGYGSCIKACSFGAIQIQNKIAVVDRDQCKGCGACVAACPRGLIELVPYDALYLVQCNSNDTGKDVMQNCMTGCIGCHMCEKNCPVQAVQVENNLAYIDTGKCIKCGQCAAKCPKNSITGKIRESKADT